MNLNFRDIASKLSTRGWIAIGAAALVGVLFVYVLMSMASSPSYTTLVAGQSPAQTEKITTALSTAGIAYQLSNSGTAVQVEPGSVGQARDALCAARACWRRPPAAPPRDFCFPHRNQSLGESNFQQEQQNTSATEQYLEQELESMNGVNSAQVDLAIPDQADNLFSGVNTQPSASVLLNTSGTLGRDRGQGDRAGRSPAPCTGLSTRARSQSPIRTATCCRPARPPPWAPC